MFRKMLLTAAVLGLSPLALAAETAPSSALLANFDFETTDAHAAWKETPGKDIPRSMVAVDAAKPHSGAAALMFQSTSESAGSKFIFTGINVPEQHGKRLRVRLFARTSGIAAGDAEINLLERDKSKVLGWTQGRQTLIRIDAGDEWKEFTAEVPIRDDARVLTFFLRINKPAVGKTLWVDDVSLEFVETP